MDDTVPSSHENSPSFQEADPKYLNSLINKHITLKLIKNCSYSGFIQSIDPVSRCIILQVPKGDDFQATLILGHAIKSLSETAPASDKQPTKKKNTELSPEEILERKTKIEDWLKRNLLPVSEKNEVIDLGNASILPPYGVNNICADSPMVANEIKKILENMPQEIQS